jgi:hypothetical protein
VASEVVALVDPIGGALTISDETPDSGYFAWDEMARVDVMETRRTSDGFILWTTIVLCEVNR